jgi:hypothetical protein
MGELHAGEGYTGDREGSRCWPQATEVVKESASPGEKKARSIFTSVPGWILEEKDFP